MFTPSMNNGRNIFVFGSNLQGRHGRGGALDAKLNWGAQQWVGRGRQGQAYAIPTKDAHLAVLDLEIIEQFAMDFIDYALDHPELTFLLTKIGCGLAGYSEKDIAPMFSVVPGNVIKPEGW